MRAYRSRGSCLHKLDIIREARVLWLRERTAIEVAFLGHFCSCLTEYLKDTDNTTQYFQSQFLFQYFSNSTYYRPSLTVQFCASKPVFGRDAKLGALEPTGATSTVR